MSAESSPKRAVPRATIGLLLGLVLVFSLPTASAHAGDGWWGALDEGEAVSLLDIMRSPSEFRGRTLTFFCVFHRKENYFDPMRTPFTPKRYDNFSAWPDGSPVWDEQAYVADMPFLYIPRSHEQRDDLMRLIATEIDRTVLHGTGIAPEPLGIDGETGIGAVTFGAAATFAKILEFESDVATANADFGTMSWVTTPAVRAAWKAISKDAGSGQFLWSDDNVNGYRALVSNQVASNVVFFGNFASAMVGSWGGQTITLDNVSLAASGQFALTISGFYDVAVRYGESFSVSTDSGAQ